MAEKKKGGSSRPCLLASISICSFPRQRDNDTQCFHHQYMHTLSAARNTSITGVGLFQALFLYSHQFSCRFGCFPGVFLSLACLFPEYDFPPRGYASLPGMPIVGMLSRRASIISMPPPCRESEGARRSTPTTSYWEKSGSPTSRTKEKCPEIWSKRCVCKEGLTNVRTRPTEML
jgi:hypothetical protein